MIGEWAALSAAACWALGSLLFERISRGNTSAGATNLAKCALGSGTLLLLTVLVRGRPLPEGASGGDLRMLALSAVVGLTLGDTAFFAALRALGAGVAVLLLSTAPVFVVFLEVLVLGKAPQGRDLGGILLALLGVALVLWRPSGTGARSWRGLWWGVLAALGQAGGSLLSRAGTQGAMDALSASWFRLAVGAAGVVGLGLVGGQLGGWSRQLREPGVVGKIAAASLVGTVLGLFLMQYGLAHSRSGGVASALLSLTPVFALPLAHLTGAERITARSGLGVLLALGGVWLLL